MKHHSFKLLPNNLKVLRILSGASQSDIANLIGISRSGYNSYEIGEKTPPLDKFLILCKYYNISPNNLINADIDGMIYKVLSGLAPKLKINDNVLPGGDGAASSCIGDHDNSTNDQPTGGDAATSIKFNKSIALPPQHPLRSLRLAHNYSITYVAAQLDIAVNTYKAYEQGIRLPSLHALCQLSSLYDIDVEMLVEGILL